MTARQSADFSRLVGHGQPRQGTIFEVLFIDGEEALAPSQTWLDRLTLLSEEPETIVYPLLKRHT